MCLAVPAQIESVNGTSALCVMSGVTKEIDVSLTPEVRHGDWVIVHVGFALQTIDALQKTMRRGSAYRLSPCSTIMRTPLPSWASTG